MIKKVCDFCNKEFFVHLYRANRAHFCSFSCYNQYRTKLAYPKRICSGCKQEFSINRETRKRKYCSPSCTNFWRIRKYSREDKTCQQCNRNFGYKPKSPHQKFCSNQCRIKARTHPANDKFFNRINSEEKAYSLGFILADGSISKSRLTIASNDKELIVLSKQLLKSSSPIHQYKKSLSLIITNHKLCDSLKKLGVLERKSWKEYSLPTIPKRLKRHFLRGFFDGDGSFYLDKRDKYSYLCASFCCASQNFLHEVKKLLNQNGIITHNIRLDRKPDDKGSWQLRITRKKAVAKLVRFLDENSNYSLKRKRQITQNFYARQT